MTTPTAQLNVGAAAPGMVETETGPIAVLRAGAGASVLMVPGYTGSKEDFGPIFDDLAAAGFAVTAMDLPGQYQSPGPADPAAYRPDLLSAAVCAVADEQPGKVHLLGHSFGGLVARAAVIRQPDLFASLVLMDSGPSAIGGQRRALIEHLEPVLVASGLAAVYAASTAIAQAQPGYHAPPAALADFLQRRFLAGVPAMLQGMGLALRTEPDRVGELAGAGLDHTLVLYGRDDDAWPPAIQDEMAQRLSARVAVIPDAAHSPAVENPVGTAAALIEFWRSVR